MAQGLDLNAYVSPFVTAFNKGLERGAKEKEKKMEMQATYAKLLGSEMIKQGYLPVGSAKEQSGIFGGGMSQGNTLSAGKTAPPGGSLMSVGGMTFMRPDANAMTPAQERKEYQSRRDTDYKAQVKQRLAQDQSQNYTKQLLSAYGIEPKAGQTDAQALIDSGFEAEQSSTGLKYDRPSEQSYTEGEKRGFKSDLQAYRRGDRTKEELLDNYPDKATTFFNKIDKKQKGPMSNTMERLLRLAEEGFPSGDDDEVIDIGDVNRDELRAAAVAISKTMGESFNENDPAYQKLLSRARSKFGTESVLQKSSRPVDALIRQYLKMGTNPTAALFDLTKKLQRR